MFVLRVVRPLQPLIVVRIDVCAAHSQGPCRSALRARGFSAAPLVAQEVAMPALTAALQVSSAVANSG